MKKYLFLLALLFIVVKTQAQNVGIGTTTPNASAMLDISSNNKGLLMPRISSTQRNAIASPAKGLIVFDTNSNTYWYYNGTAWKELAGNNYNSDSALVVGQQVGSVASHNLTVNSFSTDSSGYLYDSGGSAGNYGNNENFSYSIYTSGNQLATDIIVLSNNLESTYDSLILNDGFGHRYVLLGTTTGSFRLFGAVSIQFKSNFANNTAGFAIRWNGIFPGTKNNYDTSQTSGWYYNPDKNYMRGGVNINNNWSPDSSGMYSFAFGNNNKAKGILSTALGSTTIASGYSSTAMGTFTSASGYSSTAMGYNTTASGIYSIAMGNNTSANGNSNTAMGYNTFASGFYSTALGNFTSANGNSSIAMGYKTIASGDYSTAMGRNTTASGDYSTVMGQNTIASGILSTAMGNYTTSSGSYSTALGISTTASGSTSLAMGSGTTSSGSNSTAMGYVTTASGRASTALGLFTISKSYGGLVAGSYNDSTNAADPNASNNLNRIFQIGNGTADNARSNAMTVLQNGKVGIGLTSPLSLLDVNGDASFNDKTILLRNGANPYHGLRYDINVDGPYLFGYNGGALGTSGLPNSLTWDWNGNVSVHSNFSVQNGKGIIRSTDGTQKKELSTNVLVNVSLAVGASTSINFTFPESFSASPDVYVGNVVSGAGGWAEVILIVANVSTTGGTLYVHNSTNGTWTPNFTVKVIAIGPQ